MKKILISMIAAGTVLSSSIAFAEDDVRIPLVPVVTTVSFDADSDDSQKEKKHHQKQNINTLSKLKARGEQLINARIRSLQENNTAVQKSKLSTEQKASISAVVTTNVAGLTALKSSMASSTDATSTKTLVESVYTNFRIYGIVIPQIRLEKRIYDLQNHASVLSDSFLKVQARINEHAAKGKDVTVWQKNLEDAKLLVATDMGKLAALMVQAQALKPSDYGTSSKAIIESVNSGIKSVAKDFAKIQKMINKPGVLKNIAGGPSPLAKTEWIWVSATSNGVTTVAKGDMFVANFDSNKRITSTTDCNRLMGSYTAGTSTLSFGALAMTKMFCDGSQEGVYAELLGKVSAYSISGATLTLTHPTGTMVFRKK